MKMRYIDGSLAMQGGGGFAPPRPPAVPFPPFEQQQAEGDGGDSRVDWAGCWRSIRKRGWMVLGAALLVTTAATFYAQSISPVFRSTTTLLIEAGKTKILSIEEVYNTVSQDREYYQTQVEILRSRDVARRTVIASKLWDEPEFDPRIQVRNWSTRLRELVSPPPPQLPWTPARLAEETVGRYLAAVSIEPVRLSQLVRISFDSHDSDLSARMADATATAFIEAERDSRVKLSLSVNSQLQERLIALREKLLQSEQELQKYRELSGLVNASGSQGVAGQQMSEISQRLVAAKVRRTELESAYQQTEGITNGDYSSVAAVISQPGLMEARSRVALATLQVENVTRSLGEQNVQVIDARAALAVAQRQYQAQMRAVVGSMKAELQAARQTENSLQGALASARTSVQGVNRQEFQLAVLEREMQTNKQLYELFLSRIKETSVSSNLQGSVARIVDPAIPAGAPLRPNKPQIVMAALLLSLFGGALAAVLRDRLRNTLNGLDEAESRLHHPVLATLPAVRASEAQGMTRSYLDNPRSQHAEGIRTARTSMLLSKFVVAHKVILVTSALSGEGKTTFCTNLAFAHAQTKRTLLIDCDLRNPQIGMRLGLPADAKGISNLVSGGADLKDCVHAISGSSLLVMPAGDLRGDNPEEFLLSPPFRDALKSLANRVDIVLVDSPPVTACSDALIISQQANDTIYVVKARDTPHLLAYRGLERLRRAGASILGLVLTNVDDEPAANAGRRYGYGDTRGRADTGVMAA